MEATIAQLQAELAQLKAARQIPNETAFQPPFNEGSASRNIAPGYDARELPQIPESISGQATTAPQFALPPASTAPTLLPPTSGSIIQTQPTPTVIQAQPQFIVPTFQEDYCPISGVIYRVQRPVYYQLQPAPRYRYEWDYFDEDRAARERAYRYGYGR